MYWAEALAQQTKDKELQEIFAPIAEELSKNEQAIVSELNSAQGSPVNIDGYYKPDSRLLEKAMRPSKTFNRVLESIGLNV